MHQIALLFAGLLSLLSWLAPNHYPPWTAFHADSLMAAGFLLALISELSARRGAEIRLTALLVLSFLLVLVPPLQWWWGAIFFAGDAWLSSAYLLGFALAQVLGQSFADRSDAEAVFTVICGVFIATSISCVGLALYQWLGLHGLALLVADLPPSGRPFANVGQPNHLATLLYAGVAAVLFCHDRRRVGHGVAAVAVVFLQFGMAMSGSRTAWLGTLVMMLTLWWLGRRAPLRVTSGAVLCLGVSFVACQIMWPVLGDALLLSGGRDFAEKSDAGARPMMWATAIDAISLRPLVGYGWNQIAVAQSRVVTHHPAGGQVMDSSHNLLLDLMLSNGIPAGAFIFCCLLGWAWRRAAAARRPSTVYMLAIVGGVFMHALVEFPLAYAYFLLPVGLLMGWLDQQPGKSARWRIAIPWVVGLTVVAATVFVVIVVQYAKVEESTRDLRFELARIGSGRIQPEPADLWLLTQWRGYLRFARTQPRAGLTEDELASIDRLVERFPFPFLQYRLAVVWALNNRPERAADALQRLCSMYEPAVCNLHLNAWREMTLTTHPSLAATPLPSQP